jgi:hypothetical protein
MSYTKEICKVTDNQIVFPILDTENIGDSLSSINYNFRVLDIYTCNFEFSANNIWNPLFSTFANNSATWQSIVNIVQTKSSCWQETYNTVKALSSVWLKPISLIYPYPFNIDGSEEYIINVVTAWVNQTLPVASSTCTNFIYGQELFIFTPQYSQVNKIFSQEEDLGTRTVQVEYVANCIGFGTRRGVQTVNVNIGTQKIDLSVADQYVSNFVGLKFIINPQGTAWIYDSALYE